MGPVNDRIDNNSNRMINVDCAQYRKLPNRGTQYLSRHGNLNVDEETKESEKKVPVDDKELVTVNGVKDSDGVQAELLVDKEVELSSHNVELSDVNVSDVRMVVKKTLPRIANQIAQESKEQKLRTG